MKKQKIKEIVLLASVMAIGSTILATGYYLLRDTPSQDLCDDLMELMSDPVHAELHKKHAESVGLLHIAMQECYENKMYDMTDPNDTKNFTATP